MQNHDSKTLNRRWIQAYNDADWDQEAACRTPDYRAHMSGMPESLDAVQ